MAIGLSLYRGLRSTGSLTIAKEGVASWTRSDWGDGVGYADDQTVTPEVTGSVPRHLDECLDGARPTAKCRSYYGAKMRELRSQGKESLGPSFFCLTMFQDKMFNTECLTFSIKSN